MLLNLFNWWLLIANYSLHEWWGNDALNKCDFSSPSKSYMTLLTEQQSYIFIGEWIKIQGCQNESNVGGKITKVTRSYINLAPLKSLSLIVYFWRWHLALDTFYNMCLLKTGSINLRSNCILGCAIASARSYLKRAYIQHCILTLISNKLLLHRVCCFTLPNYFIFCYQSTIYMFTFVATKKLCVWSARISLIKKDIVSCYEIIVKAGKWTCSVYPVHLKSPRVNDLLETTALFLFLLARK